MKSYLNEVDEIIRKISTVTVTVRSDTLSLFGSIDTNLMVKDFPVINITYKFGRSKMHIKYFTHYSHSEDDVKECIKVEKLINNDDRVHALIDKCNKHIDTFINNSGLMQNSIDCFYNILEILHSKYGFARKEYIISNGFDRLDGLPETLIGDIYNIYVKRSYRGSIFLIARKDRIIKSYCINGFKKDNDVEKEIDNFIDKVNIIIDCNKKNEVGFDSVLLPILSVIPSISNYKYAMIPTKDSNKNVCKALLYKEDTKIGHVISHEVGSLCCTIECSNKVSYLDKSVTFNISKGSVETAENIVSLLDDHDKDNKEEK
jgi:hypothetical protein